MIRKLLIAVLLLFGSMRADAGFYSDIWFNPGKPGFGYNLFQTGPLIFATFFVYDSNNEPTWYVATLFADINGNFRGDVYATTGTYFASPWQAGDYTEGIVGFATFSPSNPYKGTFQFSVNGKGISSVDIERQTLLAQDFRGFYAGGQGADYSSCVVPSVEGFYNATFNLTAEQENSLQITLRFELNDGRICTLAGDLIQNGLLYRSPGATYVCSGPSDISTTAELAELKRTSQGIEGRFRAPNGLGGCTESVGFSAAFLF